MNRKLLTNLRAVSQRITWYLGTRYPTRVPLVFVVGYPRSGTVWATRLIADYLQLPYPQYSYLPVTFPAVVHGHMGVRSDYPRAIYVVRDPRDALVSRYFHYAKRVADGEHPPLSRLLRKRMPGLVNKANVRDNLPGFIESFMKDPAPHGMTWAQHVETYLDRRNDRVGLLRYEMLIKSGHEHFGQAIEAMTGQPADPERVAEALTRCSFARLSGRKPGQEDRLSAMRKGQAGDWRNHFTREAADILDRYCGDVMVRIGYEDSRDWVKQCD